MESATSSNVFSLSRPLSEYELWHNRLAHPGRNTLRRVPLATQGVPKLRQEYMPPCEGCAMGKLCRNPFPIESLKRAKRPLEIVHSDLDEMPANSIDGFKWFATFLDDYTHLFHAFYLKRKSDFYQVFVMYKAWAERQQEGLKIKTFRSDAGGEFTSDKLRDYLQEN